MSAAFRQKIFNGALVLGSLGVGAYLVGIVTVGGFYEAYNQPYSGGWSDIGYIRDAVSLCVPGVVFLLISRTEQKLSRREQLICFAFALPYLIQGLLGARRGPTFLILSAIGLGWYMMRRRRPRLVVLFIAGGVLGLLLLFLVSNRGNIYLGSNMKLENSAFQYLEVEDPENGTGNEYIYGAGTMLYASLTKDFYWGRRFFAEVFVRPIPRQLWPNKYADIGLGQLEENAGTGGEGFRYTLGWSGALGAAPGLVADLWVEFWWLSIAALYGIGWAYGRAWRAACLKGGFATLVYIFMASLSIYLVFQTIEAILVKFVFMLIPSWIVWRRANAAAVSNAVHAPPTQTPEIIEA